MTTIGSILVLGACFGGILGVSIGQQELAKKKTDNSAADAGITLVGILASLVITLIN
jgi:uncharacterized membrane protein YsdA (DUF1294 family)